MDPITEIETEILDYYYEIQNVRANDNGPAPNSQIKSISALKMAIFVQQLQKDIKNSIRFEEIF